MGLPVDILSEKRETHETIANEHNEYLQKHPEIQQILNDFVSAALVEMPDDVFHFARKHFAAPEPAKETAPK
jgi:hypothetical protein